MKLCISKNSEFQKKIQVPRANSLNRKFCNNIVDPAINSD